jgi:hypothetical protein
MHRVRVLPVIAALACLRWGTGAGAHPVADNALDVVIYPDKVVIEARITGEQVMVVEGNGANPPPVPFWPELPRSHGQYVVQHLQVKADDTTLVGRVEDPPAAEAPPTTRPEIPTIAFRLVYPLASPPGVVRIEQSFLREYPLWTAACVLRIRQSNQSNFETALLTRERTVEFGCDWSGGAAPQPPLAAPHTPVPVLPPLRE